MDEQTEVVGMPASGDGLEQSNKAMTGGLPNDGLPSVFISYAREDQSRAEAVVQQLEGQSVRSWIDLEGLLPSEEWWAKICSSIDSAEAFVFLLSNDSVTSQVCLDEYEWAAKARKKIIPVRLPDLSDDLVPQQVRQWHWIDEAYLPVSHSVGQAISDAVRLDLGWTRLHTKLTERSRDWSAKKRPGDGLLRGIELAEAEAALSVEHDEIQPQPTPLMVAYVTSSRASASRRRRRFLGLAGVVVLAASVLSVVALSQRADAERARAEERLSDSVALAFRALQLDGSEHDLALLTAVEAVRVDANFETESSLALLLSSTPGPVQYLPLDAASVVDVDASEDVVVSIAEGGRVEVWELGDSGVAAELIGHHPNGGEAIAFDAERGRVATVGGSEAMVWDLEGGEPVRLTGHSDLVTAVAFADDGFLVATAGWDQRVLVWDVATGSMLEQPEAHTGTINAVAFHPVDGTLASASQDGELISWNLRTGETMTVASGLGPINDVAYHPNTLELVTAGADGAIRVFGTTDDTQTPLQGHQAGVESLDFDESGSLLVSRGIDAEVILWDMQQRRAIAQILPASDDVRSEGGIALLGCGESVISAANGRPPVVSDVVGRSALARQRVVTKSTIHSSASATAAPVSALVVRSDSGYLVRKWRHGGGAPTDFATLDEEVSAIAVAPDGEHVAVGTVDGILVVWDGSGIELVRRPMGDTIVAVDFDPDGGTIAVAETSGTVTLVDATALASATRTIESAGPVYSLGFNATGTSLAIGGDRRIEIWDLEQRGPEQKPLILDGHASSADSLVFANDDTLASGGDDRSIRIWDLTTGKEQLRLDAHNERVLDLQFAEDGSTLVSAAEDSTIALWDMDRRAPAGGLISVSAGFVHTVSISGDGQVVAIAQRGVFTVETKPERWVVLACRVAQRSLTPQEREALAISDTAQPSCA